MAKQEDVAKLSVPQLRELAEKHNVEVASSDKKDDLVKKVSAGITLENLEDYNESQEGETTGDVKAEATEVETELGTSEEEAAAERAGVPKERLNDPKQNREPKNEFEVSNQKVTEEERQAAQKVSDMSTSDREKKAPTPNEAANTDAAKTAETNQSADIAQALVQGLKDAKGGNFELKADEGVDPRFSLVMNKEGKVLVRENETGHLSEVQLKSIEEKEASVQDQEVEEI